MSLLLPWFLAVLTTSPSPPALAKTIRATEVAPINVVTGDASWIERFGHPPTEEDERLHDEERHRVHLAWIEGKLRRASVDHLPAAARARRAAALDALAEYRVRGVHPINDELDVRRPRFVDGQGRVCAVGYMIEALGDRPLLDALDQRYEYDYVLDIDDPALADWAQRSGFTVRELASIQPTSVPAVGGGLILIGGGVLGSVVLALDISWLVTDLVQGDRFPQWAGVLELIWGSVHMLAVPAMVASAQDGNEGWSYGLAPLVAIGIAEMSHAIWSFTRSPEEAPPVRVGASPLAGGGGLVTLAGAF